MDAVWAIFGQLGITLVVAVLAAWALFRYLGDKWITNKFSAQLEAFKHAQQQELERLRLRISMAFDRAVKLHSHEYEVLPEVWERLNMAYHQILAFTSPMQRIPALDGLNQPELEHFLNESGLPEHQKEELRKAKNKRKCYEEINFWRVYDEVMDSRIHFEKYFLVKGIFIKPEIEAEIHTLKELMWEALNEARVERQYPNPREGRFAAFKKLEAEGPRLMRDIGTSIERRLWVTD